VLDRLIYNGLVDGLVEQVVGVATGVPSHVFFWNDPADADKTK
jgi:hypothetical protein